MTQTASGASAVAYKRTHLWAMDRYLIAPGLERIWHVTSSLDDRIGGLCDLIQLRERSVMLPYKSLYHPEDSALCWRERALER